MVLELQKSCGGGTEFLHTYIQFPLWLASYIHVVHFHSLLVITNLTLLLTKAHALFRFPEILPTVHFLSSDLISRMSYNI